MSFLHTLQQIIADRKEHPVPESYTASLFAAGEDEIIKKIGEEAMEVIWLLRDRETSGSFLKQQTSYTMYW